MSTCALRFDGWAYACSLGQEGDADVFQVLEQLYETHFATSFDLHPDLEHNLAIFFWLQRSLKWVDTLPDRECVLYVWLFLRLHSVEIPERYRLADYWARWEEEDWKLRAREYSARDGTAIEAEVKSWSS